MWRDPIGYAGGVNVYGYVFGSPLIFSDPNGTGVLSWLMGYGYNGNVADAFDETFKQGIEDNINDVVNPAKEFVDNSGRGLLSEGMMIGARLQNIGNVNTLSTDLYSFYLLGSLMHNRGNEYVLSRVDVINVINWGDFKIKFQRLILSLQLEDCACIDFSKTLGELYENRTTAASTLGEFSVDIQGMACRKNGKYSFKGQFVVRDTYDFNLRGYAPFKSFSAIYDWTYYQNEKTGYDYTYRSYVAETISIFGDTGLGKPFDVTSVPFKIQTLDVMNSFPEYIVEPNWWTLLQF